MENFISTLVFISPGFLMYFWIQSFGINPVVKHSVTEMSAISALLWIPVSITAVMLYNGVVSLSSLISSRNLIWNLSDIKNGTSDLVFLVLFLVLSIIVSFIFSALWSKWGYPLQRKLINRVRNWRGVAGFSENPSVWDEVFTGNDAQVVEIGKLDKHNEKEYRGLIGCINKASRQFESERLNLNDVDFFTNLIKEHGISVKNIYFDVKSSIYIKVYDPDEIRKAQEPVISLAPEAASEF